MSSTTSHSSSITSSTLSSVMSSSTLSSVMSSASLGSVLSTSTTPIPAASSAPPQAGAGGTTGPTSSPLLFFVALGFGVVFTNLWIIVGVKYCFRYNQRNRRALADENGDPIDLTAMPPRHRRRREKKLMTMDEVNERFPMLKYKAWMTARAEEGLSTAGGVAMGAAAAEEHKADRKHEELQMSKVDTAVTVPVVDGKTSAEVAVRPDTPVKHDALDVNTPESTKKNSPALGTGEIPLPAAPEKGTTSGDTMAETDDLDEDEADQIQTNLPSTLMAMPAGDTCAICIDALEDDEDVRGLTCGHAFHAHCLDPWLTSRRACCPLCKADYYVPKPRPPPPPAVDPATGAVINADGTVAPDAADGTRPAGLVRRTSRVETAAAISAPSYGFQSLASHGHGSAARGPRRSTGVSSPSRSVGGGLMSRGGPRSFFPGRFRNSDGGDTVEVTAPPPAATSSTRGRFLPFASSSRSSAPASGPAHAAPEIDVGVASAEHEQHPQTSESHTWRSRVGLVPSGLSMGWGVGRWGNRSRSEGGAETREAGEHITPARLEEGNGHGTGNGVVA